MNRLEKLRPLILIIGILSIIGVVGWFSSLSTGTLCYEYRAGSPSITSRIFISTLVGVFILFGLNFFIVFKAKRPLPRIILTVLLGGGISIATVATLVAINLRCFQF